MSRFAYSSLRPDVDEIRCVVIEPGPLDAEVQCVFQRVDLADNPPLYDALVCAHEDADDTCTIHLNGTPASIPANIELALRHLRLVDQKRILWVDALCIDQDDLPENIIQVKKTMGIFKTAQRTILWVGEPGRDGHDAMKAADGIWTWYLERGRNLPLDDIPAIELRNHGLDPRINWPSLMTFFDRPCWRDLWIFPALVETYDKFSPTDYGKALPQCQCLVLCGQLSCEGWAVDITCRLLSIAIEESSLRYKKGDAIEEPRRFLPAIAMYTMVRMVSEVHRMTKSVNSSDVETIFRAVQMLHSTDPREKVYVLSIALRFFGDRAALDIDYSKPLNDILINLVKAIFKTTQSLEFLSYNRVTPNQTFPTWVPALEEPLWSGTGWSAEALRLAADTNTQIGVEFDDERKVITASGFRIGELRDVIGPFQRDATPTWKEDMTATHLPLGPSKQLELGDVGAQLARFATSLPEGDLQCFWRALVLDADYTDRSHPVMPAPGEWEEQFKTCFQIVEPRTTVMDELRWHEFFRTSPWAWNFLKRVINRCFISTVCGKMGLGPFCSRPGDVVVALVGASRLLVLRPKEGLYEFVGDAYIQGARETEFWHKHVHEKASLDEEFTIC